MQIKCQEMLMYECSKVRLIHFLQTIQIFSNVISSKVKCGLVDDGLDWPGIDPTRNNKTLGACQFWPYV